uniref:Protein prune homolog 2-like n=1 Tax=Saccoglossus kowalevskii TaxID=10224 RepID=A0ABM0GJ84_SACKO|nr:PREDICTED: protein prune homolog 2-like [Saccoglossus kowalevskii]
MDLFLKESKNQLNNLNQYAKVHVVIGNESCDLDSTISAIVYAWFLSQTKESTEDTAYIPVLNIPRDEFRLRTEVTYFLDFIDISDANLTFFDEINLLNLKDENKLSLTLVDHNILQPKDAVLEKTVTEVIDHHSNQRGNGDDDCHVTIEMVGSCVTLVTEKIANHNVDMITEEIAMLLLGTIVLDTVNFDPAAGKTTMKDEMIASLLQDYCPNMDKDDLFDALQSAKCDISGLLTEEILRKDLKCINNDVLRIGVSSVTMDLKEFLARPDMASDMKNFCETHHIDILVVMAISIDDEITRQLGLFACRYDNIKQEILFKLECSVSPDLDLSPLTTNVTSVTAYHQGNVAASRKKILPILNEYLENVDPTDFRAELGVVTPSSDVMDLASDTQSVAKTDESGLLDFSSSATTSNTNTPISPEQNIATFMEDESSMNENLNNNTNEDPGTDGPPLPMTSPPMYLHGASNEFSDLDPFLPVSGQSNIFSNQESNGDPFGFENTESFKSKEPYILTSNDRDQENNTPSINLLDTVNPEYLERDDTMPESSSLPIGIPRRSQEMPVYNSRSPGVPLTPQNSFADHNDIFMEINAERHRPLDLSNPDIANAVHERLREVEELEEDVLNDSGSNPVKNSREAKIINTVTATDNYQQITPYQELSNGEDRVKFARRDPAIACTNVVAQTLSSEMLTSSASDVAFSTRKVAEDTRNNIVANRLAKNILDDSTSSVVDDMVVDFTNCRDLMVNDNQNIVSHMLAKDMQSTVDFTMRNNAFSAIGQDQNVVGQMLASDMVNSDEVQFVMRDGALENAGQAQNVVAHMIAGNMEEQIENNNEDIVFVKRNLDNIDSNIVANLLAAEMHNLETEGVMGNAMDHANGDVSDNATEHEIENDAVFGKSIPNELPSDNVVGKLQAEVSSDKLDDDITFRKKDYSRMDKSTARTGNIVAYMLAYTSMDETGDWNKNNEHDDDGDDTMKASMCDVPLDPFMPYGEQRRNSIDPQDADNHECELDRRMGSPSTETESQSESQTSGDELSSTSGSFSCAEMPSPVHHPISRIVEEPESSENEDVTMATRGVIESDIMGNDRERMNDELFSVKRHEMVEMMPEVSEDKAKNTVVDSPMQNDEDAANVGQGSELKDELYSPMIGEDENIGFVSSILIEQRLAKASPRKLKRSPESVEMMSNVNLKEEWQDDDEILKHQASIGEDWVDEVIDIDPSIAVPPMEGDHPRPGSLDLGAVPKVKKKVGKPAELTFEDNDDLSSQSSSLDLERIDGLATPDIHTPSLRDIDSILMTSGEMEWEDDTPLSKATSAEKIPEYTAQEELRDSRSWRLVEIGSQNYSIDMKIINPYKKVLSHGGYYGDGLNAIIVFAACYLPDRGRKDYNYVMDNLFFSKFFRKLRVVMSLAELKQMIPTEYVYIPDEVKKFDDKKNKKKVSMLSFLLDCS